MTLTGTSFWVVLIAATAVMVIGTMLLWAKIPGPRLVRAATRLIMILLCQLTAISVVAVWMNNSYGLYSSWDDLLGTGNSNTIAMPGPPVARAQFNRSGNRLLDTYFHGTHSKLSGQVIVWTPPQYDDPKYRDTRFPVLMLLHGVPGSPQSWLEHGGMPDAVQKLVDAHQAHPFILAMPVINPGGVDTNCSDVPNRKVATWLASDVPDLLQRKFRTVPGPKGWGVLGFSTGGYCAAKLPLQYPHVFGAGAALDPDPLSGDPSVLPDQGLRERNSPTHLVAGSQADVGIFLATSAQDRDSPPSSIEQFVRAAQGSKVRVKTMLLASGGHNYGTWISEYPAAIGWLSQQLTPPQQSAPPKK
ncbi:alpha/beta hydrolase-fold protein [Streptomyces sp. H10-C2]|uniref:alpha/beta hydrolase n=1 Tax=unclassified Streptomyces TaxID=2593676 RepID=UPI0024BAED43|nr:MULTISPECIES: alpha/beta hydrolase-fold protein [unclassified Streptomyces]MDJ0347264.1 alpha/beta hydrolase-fold protein [Streptomyces sp. PH10-H1]MDJ0375494.1 alpha/beta hydrolase-fold protein [Streptomyces sp. H10-C2]